MNTDTIGMWLLLIVFFVGWVMSAGPTGFMVAVTALAFAKLLVVLAQDLANALVITSKFSASPDSSDSSEGGE